MTIRTYRVTPTGRRVELSRREISLAPGPIELSSVWPDCACRRCDPVRHRTRGG